MKVRYTVPSDQSRVDYLTNGSTTVFTVPFVFFDSTDLQVVLVNNTTAVETALALTTNYTVTGGAGTAGSLTTVSTYASGSTLIIQRVVPYTQEIDYEPNDGFPADVNEEGLDRGTMQVQQVLRRARQSPQLPTTYNPDSDGDITLPMPVSGSILIGNGDNTGWENFPYPVSPDPAPPEYVKVSDYGTGITALKAAWAVSKRIILTPGEEYLFTTTADTLVAADQDIDIVGPLSSFKRAAASANVSFLTVNGTMENELTCSAINSAGTEVTIPSTDLTKFPVGSIVKVVSEDPLWHYALACKNGECAVVGTRATNLVTFSRRLKYSNITLPADFIDAIYLEISNVTDASGLFRITTATDHFLTTGRRVRVVAPGGVPDAVGEWVITRISATQFDLVGSTFAGAYTTGGTTYPSFQYSASNGLRIASFRQNTLRVNIGPLVFPRDAAGGSDMIVIKNRLNMDVRHGPVDWVVGKVFAAINCYGGRVGGGLLAGGPGGTTGYGYHFTTCEEVLVDNPQGASIRHLIDGGGGDGGSSLIENYGRVKIHSRGGYSIGSQAGAVGMHHGSDGCVFDGLETRSGDGGVVPRGIDHTVNNLVSYDDGSAVSSFIQYIYEVTAITDNGAGLCRVVVNQDHSFVTGQCVRVRGVLGTTEANGRWVVTVINSTTFDLVGSAFANAFTSSGDAYSGHAYSGNMVVNNLTARGGRGVIIGTGTTTGDTYINGGFLEAVGGQSNGIIRGHRLYVRGTVFSILAAITNRVVSLFTSSQVFDAENVTWRFGDFALPSRFIDNRNNTSGTVTTVRNNTIIHPGGAVAAFYDRGGSSAPTGSSFANLNFSGSLTALETGIALVASRARLNGPVRAAGLLIGDRTMATLGATEAVTIATGVVTAVANRILVSGEGGLADDLVTINGGADGDLLLVRMNSAGTITVKDSTGNIVLGADRVLDATSDTLLLERRASTWSEIAFANNA